MKVISHRGNIHGPDKNNENKPSQILLAIEAGFDVELDLWVIDNNIFLGHDFPQYKINFLFLKNIKDKAWIHCKNLEAIYFLQKRKTVFNYFWHQNDDFTLTSLGYIWTYPMKESGPNSVIVSLRGDSDFSEMPFGVCTDFPKKIRTELANDY
jgi:hypothetical protein